MKLTVGMATIEDYDGVYFTLQSLRLHHPLPKEHELEIIVVDNKPDSKASPHLRGLLENWVKGRYIPMPEPQGTTQSRNRIFTEATGDAVLCIDSHVLLAPGAVERLINFYVANPATRDLLSGPMLSDDLSVHATHFDDVWRAEMWGIWGRAWGCSGRLNTPLASSSGPTHTSQTVAHAFCHQRFTLLEREGRAVPHTLSMNPQPFPLLPSQEAGVGLVYQCPTCHYIFPKEINPPALKATGFIDLAEGHEPFEIPGMGLGLFTCRREAWLGFNPHFTAFGGEELYIHEKYRQAGAKCLCLPWLKWGHRFGRPGGIPYQVTRYHKVRNYILGHQELGLPLTRPHEHFVKSGLMHQQQWDHIVKDPIEAGKTKLNFVSGLPQPRASVTHPLHFVQFVKENPRDLDQHIDKLFELSSQVEHATELTHRRESTIGLLGAKRVLSFNAETDDTLIRLTQLFREKLKLTNYPLANPLPEIEETDLLFIDTIHTAPRLWTELQKYHAKVRRWIVLHDTHLHGEFGEDIEGKKQPGLLPALRRFMQDHPEWSVIYHTGKQYGLTVVGKLPGDKPPLPSVLTMAANFTQFLATHVATGMHAATKEEVEQRLTICTTCDQRNENRCAVCGCGLAQKAAQKVSDCPLGKWPKPQQTAAA